MPLPATIHIATRQSKLALIQAQMICDKVSSYLSGIGEARPVALLPMLSTGDKITDRHLLEIGGKGLFTKEIEAALLSGQAQIAMHSLKDMPASMPTELMIGGVLPREDYRDAMLTRHPITCLDDLPHSAVVGTSSPRRAAQLQRLRPDLVIVPFRGNVPTRLEKLAAGEVDATILAVAGLKRLGLEKHISLILPPEMMLPAIGQGIIAMQCRKEDLAIRELLQAINDQPSWQQCQAERGVLEQIEGDCHTPLAGIATFTSDKQLHLKGRILSDNGSRMGEAETIGPVTDAPALGKALGEQLKQHSATVWQ